MRILYSHRIQSRDGQSVHLEEMVAAFRQAGHEVLVVGPGFYASSAFGAESHFIAALRRHLPAALAEMAELAYNIPAWWRLRREASMFQPDLIYERYNLYFLAGAWLARMRKIRYFVEVNSPLAEEREAHGGLRLRRIAHGTERAVWRQADRVLAVSHVLAARIEAAGVNKARIAVTPNGVDLARFAGLPPRDPTRPPVLGFIGFVRPWHGLEAVIEAMGRHDQQLELIIAGEGPARDGLEKQAMAAGCAARVKFIGLTARDDVPLLLSRFDIALQPQSVDYASPLKLFEYMAAGCAIIAPDQPNIREIVEHGVTAWLFDPQEPGALWQAVARLVADPALRQNLGRNAAAAIITRDLTWAGNARRVVEWAESR